MQLFHGFRVQEYVDQINARMSRQVAISIRVFSMEINDSTNHSLSLSTIVSDLWGVGISTTAGAPITSDTGVGTLTAMLLPNKNKMSGSQALIEALEQRGNVARVASGSGVAMHNSPLPIQDTFRTSYLSESSVTVVEGTTTSSLVPGQVTTGFAATIIPSILDNNKCVLQYTLNLSTLDGLDTISSGGTGNEQIIQLPQVATRAFHQRVAMDVGSTLVLAGFEQDEAQNHNGIGLLSYGKKTSKTNRLILIAIDVNGLPGANGGKS